MKKVALAADHGGFGLKTQIKDYLLSKGYEVLDLGTDSETSVDYPDFGAKAAEAVLGKQADCAIIMCGTGIGISITANKFKGIRCALCFDSFTARLARMHNDANIMALGGRVITFERATEMVDIFLNTPFEGGRHERRINKIDELAAKSWC